MRSYTFGFALNVVVLGILIYVSIFNIATTADGSADGPCEHVDCANGKCVETGEFLGLGFKCVCDPGWKQMQLGPVAFPACNIPNCTLDLGCESLTPSPHRSPQSSPFNITDPCSLIWCGNGKCEVSGTGCSCKCNEGSTRYRNMSKLPCLDECVFGADCKGALVPWLSLPPPPSPGHGVVHGQHQSPQSLLSSSNDGICNYVDCGKGKCVETGEFLGLGFKCVCNPGWKQIQLGTIVFPSCNVPNCTLNLGCGSQEASPPAFPALSFNISDPCSIAWCNNGKCEVIGTKPYCQCNEGSENLMDMPALPCFDQCVLGADCKGVELGGDPSSLPPPPPPGNGSSGVPNCSRSLCALTVLLLFTIFPILM